MAVVVAVSRSAAHTMSKQIVNRIVLVAGIGVDGDAHAGATDRHRARVTKNANAPNLRQVHLIHSELHDDLNRRGLAITAGTMGENITTRGVELLALPVATRLRIGDEAVVEVTGLRNPCAQLDGLQRGLMAAVIDRDDQGYLVRKTGIMAIVLIGGAVCPGDAIVVELPPRPHRALGLV